MRRVVFHIDVNSAFVSWSAVKILSEGGADIRIIPSVVSGDPNDRRSIVAAKSIPCRKYGINTAEPLSMALRKCPGLVVVHGDWSWYRQCSDNFIAICRTFSPVLQQFSVDECFLEMTEHLKGLDPIAIANELREKVKRRLGFTVNVGIGSNKLLAKMASDFEKPDKVHTLWKEEVPQKMWPLPVRELLWVGKRTEERLTAYGVDTIGKLAKLKIETLTSLVGHKSAVQMHESANGIDNSPVDIHEAEAKSYSAERTFRQDITDPALLDRELFNVAVEVAHRIRLDDFRAKGISVFVKTREFEVHSKQCTLQEPTDVTALILNAGRELIPSVWDRITPLRQVGLGVFKLTHDRTEQLLLFEDDEKMEYYREWDREYDARMDISESGSLHSRGREKILTFSYGSGEQALLAAKHTVREDRSCSLARHILPDGTDCFEIMNSDGRVIERHQVNMKPRMPRMPR